MPSNQALKTEPSSARPVSRWDIFCRIVDNYGDIGVCWRLARQLTAEYGLSLRLWVDDLAVAKRLIPGLDSGLETQFIDGVEIRHWLDDFPEAEVADVVIEAFACDIPQRYLAAMVEKKPIWLNLEYLSAEPWVADFHLQPSPHPSLPLVKYFFFPGFSHNTGGLLREHGLITVRDAFRLSKHEQSAFCERLDISDETLRVSLFCYPHAAVADLLDSMATSPVPVLCLVTDGKLLAAISSHLGKQLSVGEKITHGNLTLQALPFLGQADYDRLLWLCDFNFVRGEDSWLRAIWARKPMLWQPYRQEEDTHMIKLNAFLACYLDGLAEPARHSINKAHLDWASGLWSAQNWPVLMAHLPILEQHATDRAARLSAEPDLAAKLVIFCKNFF
ncbi:MAG TPA: elongation factor P maturation arginine rhamnosyltransferase EarP [Methylophilaceae bacterium]|nr:elongation factor P maturation arginine rhamnosyltransferase EarP [Methylophilaceae bacterium]